MSISAGFTLVVLVAAIVCFVGGWLAPEFVALSAAGLLIAIGGACSMLTLAPAWATAADVGGRHAGVTAGTMNTVGQVGGILSPLVLAYLVDATNNWNFPLLVLAGIYAVAALAWLMVDPSQRVERPDAARE